MPQLAILGVRMSKRVVVTLGGLGLAIAVGACATAGRGQSADPVTAVHLPRGPFTVLRPQPRLGDGDPYQDGHQ
jgi:hypothetical protein